MKLMLWLNLMHHQTQLEADVDSLAAKYDAEPANTAVDDELAALKAQMGIE